MKYQDKMVLVAIIALLLGLVTAIPLFQSNVNPTKTIVGRPFIDFDVVYVYFSLSSYSENAIGLNNSTDFNSGSMIDFILIVNITNHSNNTVYIDGITLYAAPYINTTNTKSEFSQCVTGSFLRQELGFNPYSNMVTNPLRYLVPYQSKLIALSGTTELGSNSLTLQSGTIYVGGKIDGIYEGGIIDGSIQEWHSTWGGSKQVQMQYFGNEYLYNTLVRSNQTLHLQGNSVYIK